MGVLGAVKRLSMEPFSQTTETKRIVLLQNSKSNATGTTTKPVRPKPYGNHAALDNADGRLK